MMFGSTLAFVRETFESIFWSPNSIFFVGYLLANFAFAACVYLVKSREYLGRRVSPAEFLRFCFKRDAYLGASALVDLKMFVVNRVFFRPVSRTVRAATVGAGSALVIAALARAFGNSGATLAGSAVALVAAVVGAVLIEDLTRFLLHYLCHRVPAAWRFHKVHHTATQLNPLTLEREHPFVILARDFVGGFGTGCVFGTFLYLTGTPLEPRSLAGYLAFRWMTYGLIFTLHHTHIWISFGPALGRIFVSPAYHQIHHSSDPKHFDRNLGSIFSFWDAIFRTQYLPGSKEDLSFGLGQPWDQRQSLLRMLFDPVREIRGERPVPAPGAHEEPKPADRAA